MKALYIISKGMDKPSDQEIRELEKKKKIPRQSYLEDELRAEVLDERFLENKAPLFRRVMYRFLPTYMSQVIEALSVQKNYTLIISQAENAGLPLTLLMKYLGLKTPHIIILSRITSVNESKSSLKKWFVKEIKDKARRFLIWSSRQREIAIEQLGVDPSKIVLIKRGTDDKFWVPQERKADMICSVGMEARDYPTLVEALRPLNIPCHICAGESRGVLFETVKRLYDIEDMPSNITIGEKKPDELKELYARCRFVVVPLLPSDSDNGLTTILEAMAMGKPVICSRTEGQIDVIEDGVTGIFVPPGDPVALREAIEELWKDPGKCEKMGRKARKFIEKNHNLEQFVEAIKRESKNVVLESKQYETNKTDALAKG